MLHVADRTGCTAGLNLDTCGALDRRGRFSVDQIAIQTNKSHIYAIGNVISFLNLASLGGTLGYFIENTFTYPTLAEAYHAAVHGARNGMPRG